MGGFRDQGVEMVVYGWRWGGLDQGVETFRFRGGDGLVYGSGG